MHSSGSIPFLVGLALAGTGCSWLGVTPRMLERPGDGCTESTAAPVADTVGALFFGLVGLAGVVFLVAGAKSSSGPGESCGGCNVLGAVVGGSAVGAGLLFGLPYGLSARYGFGETDRCRGRRDGRLLDVNEARSHPVDPLQGPAALPGARGGLVFEAATERVGADYRSFAVQPPRRGSGASRSARPSAARIRAAARSRSSGKRARRRPGASSNHASPSGARVTIVSPA